LNFEQIKMTPVLFPPLAEQRRIVTEVAHRLSLIDELEANISVSLSQANHFAKQCCTMHFSMNHLLLDKRLLVNCS